MAENSPAYLMYPDDILASGRVNSLEPLEELWYRRAIDLGWKNLGMPSDPVEFAGWVGRGCTPEAAEKIIKKMYVPHKKDPSKVINERQEKERKILKAKRKKKSDAGKLGMAKRWKQKGNPDNSVITNDNISISTSTSIEEESSSRVNTSPPASENGSDPPQKTEKSLDRLDPADAKSFGFAVEQFVSSFPNVRITLIQAGLLASAVVDNPNSRKAWNNTIGKYIGNRDPIKGSYDPGRIGTIIEVYRDEALRLERSNGSNQQNIRQTASERNVERYVAGRDLAQRIANGEANEALESIYGGVGDNHRKDPDPLQLTTADGQGITDQGR